MSLSRKLETASRFDPIRSRHGSFGWALSTNPEFLRVIQAAREEVRRGEVVSLDEMKREFAGE